jgi:L-arabinose isomerase
MEQPSSRPRIGLLALTLEMHERHAPGLRQQREQWLRAAVLPVLAVGAEIQFRRAVFRREDVEAVVNEYQSAGVDALLVIFLTYAPSQIVLPALRRTTLPVVLWNTQELWSVNDGFTMEHIYHNHGVHGTQDLTNVLIRSGVPFHYVTSHPSDADGLDRLFDFFRAARAVTRLRWCRLGLLGYPFPGMGDFAGDTTHWTATIGCSCESLSIEEYHRRAAAASSSAVAEVKSEYRRLYEPGEDLQEADLNAAVRAELSLRSMVADHHLDALSFQFLALGEDERTETLPFVAVSRMMADGIGYAGEGDLLGAAGTWFLNRLQPPASFSEIFTIDFAGNGLLISHMGEANVAMARRDRKVPLAVQPHPIVSTRSRQLALITSFEPGPATLCALTLGLQGRWRLIVSALEIQDFGPLASLPIPHCKVMNHCDVRKWLTDYARAGGPHHHAICFGDARPKLKLAAALLDADYYEV